LDALLVLVVMLNAKVDAKLAEPKFEIAFGTVEGINF
jgi:hypothetical protein